jgi:hypothetical protein
MSVNLENKTVQAISQFQEHVNKKKRIHTKVTYMEITEN